MPLPLVLAFRSLAFRRLQSVVAVLGVALGVLALNLIVGIQNGFRQAFVEQILESAGHVTLSAPGARIGNWEGRIEMIRRELPEVAGAAPAILGQAILEVETAFAGVNFKAVEPDREPEVTRLLEHVVAGEARFRGVNEVLVGSKLAAELRIKVDTPVKLVLPGGQLYDLWVRGIVESGVGHVDSQLILVSRRFAAKALKFGEGVSHIFLACRDPERADAVARDAARLTGLRAESWKDEHETLLKAMELERRAMFVIIALTLAVAGFGVSNVLTLMVYDRWRDIGILRSMGAPRPMIRSMFLLQGLLLGVGGTVVGLAGTGVLAALLRRYPIPLPGGVYYANTLPIRFDALEGLAVCILAVAIATLAGMPSAARALAVEPAEVVHAA